MSTTFYNVHGEECDEMDHNYDYSEEESTGCRDPRMSKDGLYFHHHIVDDNLKKVVVEAFNDEGFLVEWDMSDAEAIKIHSV
jgi:hypothetical protein